MTADYTLSIVLTHFKVKDIVNCNYYRAMKFLEHGMKKTLRW